MATCASWSFMATAAAYTVTFALLFSPFRRTARAVFLCGLAANALSVGCRTWNAWPLLPLYQTPFFLPLASGALCVRPLLREMPGNGWRILPILLTAAFALFFPKDYYLSFIHSNTLFAHLFFAFGTLGKACLFMASAEAAWILAGRLRLKKVPHPENPSNQSPDSPAHPSTDLPIDRFTHSPTHRFTASPSSQSVTRWIAWGFGFLTLSMFSGELWSYLGWGSPLVWDDPAVMSTLSVWCFYACLLHLHLSRSWSVRGRLTAAAGGAVLLLVFTAVSEMGVFQWPKWQ